MEKAKLIDKELEKQLKNCNEKNFLYDELNLQLIKQFIEDSREEELTRNINSI